MPLDYVIPGLAQMRPNETAAGGGHSPGPAARALAHATTAPAAEPEALPNREGKRPGRRGPGGGGGGANGAAARHEHADDELVGSVPLDPQFMGADKADLASRVTRAERLIISMRTSDRLDQENDRSGGKQLLEMEHAQAPSR